MKTESKSFSDIAAPFAPSVGIPQLADKPINNIPVDSPLTERETDPDDPSDSPVATRDLFSKWFPYEAAYHWYDAEVRENFAQPAWFYANRDVYAEVTAMDATATVVDIKCGKTVCRVDIRHESEAARDRFAISIPQRINAGRMEPGPPIDARQAPQSASTNKFTEKNSSDGADITTIYRHPSGDSRTTLVYVIKSESTEDVFKRVQAKVGW